MRTIYGNYTPHIEKDLEGNISEIFHSHEQAIDYHFYNDRDGLNEKLDNEKIALTGCITFFQTLSKNKDIDGLTLAVAKSAVEEDKIRLKMFEKHRRPIISDSICEVSCNLI